VFQGNNVRDENSDHALFNELGSSPASMEVAKLLDAFGSHPISRSSKLMQSKPTSPLYRGAHMVVIASEQVAKGLGKEMLAANSTNAAGPIWSS